MKNFDKYEKEIMEYVCSGDTIAIVDGKPVPCSSTRCEVCLASLSERPCGYVRKEWFNAEYTETIKLNKYERSLCEALQKGWIAKNKGEGFSIYEEKPKKMEDFWYGAGYYTSTATIRHINPKIRFSFMNWEDAEPWSVAALLELEVEE